MESSIIITLLSVVILTLLLVVTVLLTKFNRIAKNIDHVSANVAKSAGFFTGILLAPKRGKETREDIMQ